MSQENPAYKNNGDKYEDFKNTLPAYVKNKNDFELYKMRHSTEHVLHLALSIIYPEIKRAMGPAIEEGFYCDFDPVNYKLSEENFSEIEKKMQEIIKLDLPLIREELSYSEASKLFKNNEYKQEWIAEAKKNKQSVTVYWTGDKNKKEKREIVDVDFCKGPHVGSTGQVGPFKLLSIAGAYWHGDEKNKMLTRIYGTSFFSKEELKKYIWQIEEAKNRDHRKIGKQLDLFTFSDLIGSGFPLYTPRGALIRRLINNHVESIQSKQGYMQVWTPQVAKAELFKTSGHYLKYKDDMFRVISNYSDEEFFLKPMNCPQHTQIYCSKSRSYRELPIRMTDFAMLYRDEKPGELSGLARVRSFSQDDCHIFCSEDQVDEEIDKALQMTKEIMGTYGFKYKYRLSTRDPKHPEKYLGDPDTWDKVEKWAVRIMKRNKIEYFDGPGEAAFYAPKMDLIATDALGREWQLSTVQIDYVMPERFDLKYTDKDGQEKHPVMLHRAIVGSPERFIMVLLEHFSGALPVWLHPDQVAILPVSEKHIKYAEIVKKELISKNEELRVSVDDSNESLGKKIRNAQLMKIPYIVVVGEKEQCNDSVNVRLRTEETLGEMKVSDFFVRLNEKILTKALDL